MIVTARMLYAEIAAEMTISSAKKFAKGGMAIVAALERTRMPAALGMVSLSPPSREILRRTLFLSNVSREHEKDTHR